MRYFNDTLVYLLICSLNIIITAQKSNLCLNFYKILTLTTYEPRIPMNKKGLLYGRSYKKLSG